MEIHREQVFSTTDYILESEYGMQEIVIIDPQTGGGQVLSGDILRLPYLIGERHHTSNDEAHNVNLLFQKANDAILVGDFLKADLYLGLNYWNEQLMSIILEKTKEKSISQHYLNISKKPSQCYALYAAIEYKHIYIMKYVLSKINACNISIIDFNIACLNGLASHLCEKDPDRFYSREYKCPLSGDIKREYLYRTPKEMTAYLLNKTKYYALAIHAFPEKIQHNNIIKSLPKDVLRYALNMI